MRREWGQSDMLAYPVFYAARYMPASVRAVKTPSRKAKRSLTGCAASPIPSYRRKLNARSLIQAPLRRPGDAFAVRRLFAVEGPSGKVYFLATYAVFVITAAPWKKGPSGWGSCLAR